MTLLSAENIVEPIITVSTVVENHEDISMVKGAVTRLFPDWDCTNSQPKQEYPIIREAEVLTGNSDSLSSVIENCKNNRILDTALDAMTLNLIDDCTSFFLSRQAAFVGKVSFVVDESPMGGVIEVGLQGENLGLWLEQQTWHEGRNSIPRTVGDDLQMENDGTPKEWFDNRGRRTINLD
jgi:predicted RNA binding protein with dsRBD fold (UPF0201 family)|tara:strand:- start:2474 stop:3013 length:540 start_codon:yes stop_codon:yes gene_type:complete